MSSMIKQFREKMEITMGVWVAIVIGGLSLMLWVVWWWNDIWYALPLKLKSSDSGGSKLPPGYMGLPFVGEMIAFLWYFKVLRRPDEFINAKKRKYGEGVELFRTHLFGSPSIIACSPSLNKFVLQSDKFVLVWPNVELMGHHSVVAVHGQPHARLRNFITKAINQPSALSHIALMVQPRIVAALETWAHKGTVKAYDEAKKVTMENVGKLFVGMEPGPGLTTMDKLFRGMLHGVRAQPVNFQGFAFYHGLQCRKKLDAMFRVEMEKKKKKTTRNAGEETDLMDGLMEIKDDDGNKLSDQEVIDNIVSLVIAGYESTTLATTWATYYLAKYPDVLNKLRAENMAIKEKRKGGFITSDDVSQMSYTSKVVNETIRLANISSILFRLATSEIEYKGYKIPKNWKVILWVRYLHTSPENFTDPLCFNPDRWNEPPKPGSYQVFGGGPRICAGNMLARLQLSIFLHHLSTGYKWKLLKPDGEIIYLSHPKPVDGAEIAISKI